MSNRRECTLPLCRYTRRMHQFRDEGARAMAKPVRRKSVLELVSKFEEIAHVKEPAIRAKLGKKRPSFVSYTSWRGSVNNVSYCESASDIIRREHEDTTFEIRDISAQLNLITRSLSADFLESDGARRREERARRRAETLKAIKAQGEYAEKKTQLLEKVTQITVQIPPPVVANQHSVKHEEEANQNRRSTSASTSSNRSSDEYCMLDCYSHHTYQNLLDVMNSGIVRPALGAQVITPKAKLERTSSTSSGDKCEDYEEDENSPMTITMYEPVVNASMAKRKKKHHTALHYKTQLTVLGDQDKTTHTEISTVKLSTKDCVEQEEVQKFKDTKEHIVDELINSEEYYITQLQCAVNVYQEWLSDQIGEENTLVIFGVLEDILTGTTEMLKEIKKIRFDYEAIGIIFLQNIPLFEMYPVYCKNKKKSEELCKRFENEITQNEIETGDKLGLSLLLLLPIQRLAKYELLLNKLKKHLEKDESPVMHVSAAANLIQNISLKGNDLLELDLIRGKSFEFTSTGNFIMRNSFRMITPIRAHVVLFLFNHKVIITKKDKIKTDNYLYFNHIDMNEISYNKEHGQLTTFGLSRIGNGKKLQIRLDAQNADIKERWLRKIENIMWTQLNEAKRRNIALYENT